jgi:anti-sigma B factor antagonist
VTSTGYSEFSFVLTRDNGRVTISIEGELDAYTSPRLGDALSEVIADGEREVVLDASGMTFLDSTGLGTIVHGHKRLREHGGSLAITGPRTSVFKVIEMTGLHRLIPVVGVAKA